MPSCEVIDLGLIDVDEAYVYQRAMLDRVLTGGDHALLLCEHPSVLTMGRMFKEENLFFTADELRKKGVALRRVDRGGDITLHAPGQLVIYPIIQLQEPHKDLRWYLRQLEAVVVGVLKEWGVTATGNDQQRGVWVGRDKIASMGVGVKKWVCYHGVGLNVNTDLSLFSLIRPCGLDVQMTSLQQLTGSAISMDKIKKQTQDQVGRVFGFNMREDSHDNNCRTRVR